MMAKTSRRAIALPTFWEGEFVVDDEFSAERQERCAAVLETAIVASAAADEVRSLRERLTMARAIYREKRALHGIALSEARESYLTIEGDPHG